MERKEIYVNAEANVMGKQNDLVVSKNFDEEVVYDSIVD